MLMTFASSYLNAAFAKSANRLPKPRDSPDGALHMLDRDQPGALELARRACMARAPEEVLVIESQRRIVPAGVAGVVVDDPPGRLELGRRMGEAADQDDLRARRPSEPREAARQPDQEIRVPDPAHAFLQREASAVLGAVGDLGPREALFMGASLVDADDAVAGLLQEADDLEPAVRIVPLLGLGRGLHADADIGLDHRRAVAIRDRNSRSDFARVDA